MRLHYSGDRNIEYGGVFYSLKTWKWGYVNAVRVTPCSDAGGPDNCFWVERLTVNIRTMAPELDNILNTCGYSLQGFKDQKLTRAQIRHLMVDAHIAYGAYDIDSSMTVKHGKDSDPYRRPGWDAEGFKNPDVTLTLRGNASLRRYVRDIALEHCA